MAHLLPFTNSTVTNACLRFAACGCGTPQHFAKPIAPNCFTGAFSLLIPFRLGEAFHPEDIHNMSRALRLVCDASGLKYQDNAAATVAAEKIVELAQRGVRDVPTLTAQALKELRH
jgi:hypothetical protein